MGKYIIFEEGDALLVIDAINKVLGWVLEIKSVISTISL
jgi:hypothetical protein